MRCFGIVLKDVACDGPKCERIVHGGQIAVSQRPDGSYTPETSVYFSEFPNVKFYYCGNKCINADHERAVAFASREAAAYADGLKAQPIEVQDDLMKEINKLRAEALCNRMNLTQAKSDGPLEASSFLVPDEDGVPYWGYGNTTDTKERIWYPVHNNDSFCWRGWVAEPQLGDVYEEDGVILSEALADQFDEPPVMNSAGIKKLMQGEVIEFHPHPLGGYTYTHAGMTWGIDDLSDESLDQINMEA